LTSLKGQEAESVEFEIIVVDNGSDTPPSDVCAAFENVRLEVERQPGPGPARNKGAAVARGEILAFIDADCVAAPDWIRQIVAFMSAREDVDFIGGDIRILQASARALTPIEAYESIYSYRNDRYVTQYGFSATGNMAVRKKVFEAVGPFGGIGTMEDTDWGMKATAMGFKIAYVPSAKVFTEPCASYAALTLRWDRHVAHEFEQIRHHYTRYPKWLFKSVAIAASPLGEQLTVIKTRRISGVRTRLGAYLILTRVRLHRAKRMFGLLFSNSTSSAVGTWNREKT